MRLPNKVTPFAKSVIAWFPAILDNLQQRDMTPQELLEALLQDKQNMGDFLDALDCLAALGKIELIDERRALRYVGRD